MFALTPFSSNFPCLYCVHCPHVPYNAPVFVILLFFFNKLFFFFSSLCELGYMFLWMALKQLSWTPPMCMNGLVLISWFSSLVQCKSLLMMVMMVVISSDGGDGGDDGDVWISQIWSEVFPRSLNWSRRPAAASPPFPIFINFSFLPWSADHLIPCSFDQLVGDQSINLFIFSRNFSYFCHSMSQGFAHFFLKLPNS